MNFTGKEQTLRVVATKEKGEVAEANKKESCGKEQKWVGEVVPLPI